MDFASSLLCFVLFLLLILVQAKGRTDSTCPKSFSCGNLTDLSFPFSLSTQPDCGILHMSGCDAKSFPRIQLLPGGDWYYDALHPFNYTVGIADPKLLAKLRRYSCQAFNKNISLPDSPSISFKILPLNFANFFKCNSTSSSTPNITQKKNDHFASYKKYTLCKGFSIYYKLPQDDDKDVHAGNLPADCSLVRLPINETLYNGGLFTFLSPVFLVEWKLSEECNLCHYSGGQCQTDISNKFRCAYPNNKHAQDHQENNPHPQDILWYTDLLLFELEEATNDFNSSRVLGDGGFGTVYYGKLRDGREVAVKRLYEHNCKRMRQLVNEIEILTRLRHNNIVTLYGCTSKRSRELLPVYEYIQNGTLADRLHGDRAKQGSLTWPIRMNIAIETVSRMLPVTKKSDVYSFGVVLVELISSMPAVDMNRHSQEINLANFAINKIIKSAFQELIDPSLGVRFDTKIWEMTTSVVELAFLCLQTDRDMRPTMVEVLDTLKEIQNNEFDNEKRAKCNFIGNEAKIVTAPPFPEMEDKSLLKQVKSLPSPNSVTDKWITCSSITSTK
ncbi:unnamed protein product [Withania somnifera]